MKGGVENGLDAEEFDEFDRFFEIISRPFVCFVFSECMIGEARPGNVSCILAMMRGKYRDSPPRSVEMRFVS